MKARISLILIIAFAMITVTALSQEKQAGRNEIRLGYGAITGPELANSLFSLWPAIGMQIWKDTIHDYVNSFYGVADLEYNRFVTKWLSVGVSVSLNPISTLITTTNHYELSWNYYVINIMPKITFYYVNKGIFSLYSGAEVGGALILWKDKQGALTMNDTGGAFAFHIDGIGVRIGKEIGAYMEWGFGFRGTVNFGISGKF